MKKTLYFSLAFALLLLLFSGCSSSDVPQVFREVKLSDNVAHAQSIYYSFEEAVSTATDIIEASFTAYHEYDNYTELEFEVLDVVKGSTTAPTIYVNETPRVSSVSDEHGNTFSIGDKQYNFVPEHRYLLVLSRYVSVSYEHDRYSMIGDIFIPLDDNIGVYMYFTEVGDHIEATSNISTTTATSNEVVDVEDSVAEYVSVLSMQSAADTVPFIGTEYIRSTNLNEIVEETPYIVKVTIGDFFIAGDNNEVETFRCRVDESIRVITPIPTQILVPFNSGMVESGEEYILLLNRVNSDSLVFPRSSKNSVIPLSDTETVQEVRDLVAAQSGTVTE